VSKGNAKRTLTYDDSSSESETLVDLSSDSCADNESEAEREVITAQDLSEGVSFVIVVYCETYYPGKVVELKENTVRVSCMTRSLNKTWKWGEEDEHDYPLEDIVRIIKPPTICSSRGQCLVPEVESYYW
jgi:hypothetical protein